MYCRNCGVEHQNGGELFCKSCGYKVTNGKNYCFKCGSRTYPEDTNCPECNAPLKQHMLQQNNSNYNQYNNNPNGRMVYSVDEPNTLANFATFCCSPIVGIILYLVWKDEKPRAAESVCHWTIAAFILYGLIYLISFIIQLSMLGM